MLRALLTAMLLTAFLAPLSALAADATVVIVVRHAEKATDDPRDPTLSADGQARAQALAATLAGAGLDAAYATQFRRTQLTATPAAEAAGIEVQVRPISAENAATYDADLARDLRALPAGSTALIVGHSNTVPGLVKAIAGADAAEMPESEFDRYTVILLPAEGPARVITTRY
jgi:broad specificity phosphatase PhoE